MSNTFNITTVKKTNFLIALLVSTGLSAQDSLILGPETLIQLKKPHTVLNKYVNFDVLKLMIGTGAATNSINYSANMSTRFQLLNPFAFSKRFLKIAYGLTYCTNRVRAPRTSLDFEDGELKSIENDEATSMTMIRTRSLGLIFLRVIRIKDVTLLLGPSVEYNLSACVRTKNLDKEKEIFSIKGAVNKLSIPLNFQLSISKKQFLAFGFFGRYDLRPLFKSPQFNKLKLFTIGLSGSVII